MTSPCFPVELTDWLSGIGRGVELTKPPFPKRWRSVDMRIAREVIYNIHNFIRDSEAGLADPETPKIARESALDVIQQSRRLAGELARNTDSWAIVSVALFVGRMRFWYLHDLWLRQAQLGYPQYLYLRERQERSGTPEALLGEVNAVLARGDKNLSGAASEVGERHGVTGGAVLKKIRPLRTGRIRRKRRK